MSYGDALFLFIGIACFRSCFQFRGFKVLVRRRSKLMEPIELSILLFGIWSSEYM